MPADEESSAAYLIDDRKRKSDGSSSRVKRRLEGYGGDSGVYLPSTPLAGLLQWKSVSPNENVETASTLTFEVLSSDNELVR
jgi:hypothetical protein